MIVVKQLCRFVPLLKFSKIPFKALSLEEKNWHQNVVEAIKFIKCKSFTEYSNRRCENTGQLDKSKVV